MEHTHSPGLFHPYIDLGCLTSACIWVTLSLHLGCIILALGCLILAFGLPYPCIGLPCPCIIVEFLRQARSIWISFIFGQITHVQFFMNYSMYNISPTWTSSCHSEINFDMCYLFKDETYPCIGLPYPSIGLPYPCIGLYLIPPLGCLIPALGCLIPALGYLIHALACCGLLSLLCPSPASLKHSSFSQFWGLTPPDK